MKKTLALLALASLTLSGCVSYPEIQDEPPKQGQQTEQGKSTTPEERNRTRNIHVMEVERNDGSFVECVVYDEYQGGGISCNWGAAP